PPETHLVLSIPSHSTHRLPLSLHDALPIYLAQYRHWRPYLHDLGECEVKHGLRLHLFNLCKDGIGNLAPPQKFKRWSRRPCLTRSEEHTSELQSQSNLVCRLLLEKKKSPTV